MEVKRCSHFGMTFSFGGSFERWRTFNCSELFRCPRALTERNILSVFNMVIGLSLISCEMNFYPTGRKNEGDKRKAQCELQQFKRKTNCIQIKRTHIEPNFHFI
jgi:hypothetical protein